MPLSPPQWGSAPTRTSNVNIVRHVKDTVEMQKKEGKDITWLPPCPFGRCRLIAHTAQGGHVRSLLRYFFLSLRVLRP